MADYIRNEFNEVVGFSERVGSQINYVSNWFGLVGVFYLNENRYQRLKMRPGDYSQPFPGNDYGLTDVLYWATQKGNRV